MQAVPPDDGAIDDRNVDGPDQSETRCHAAHAPTSACVIDAACIGKRDIAQIRNSSTSIPVMRPSHSHHVHQVGQPHSAPAYSQMAEKHAHTTEQAQPAK